MANFFSKMLSRFSSYEEDDYGYADDDMIDDVADDMQFQPISNTVREKAPRVQSRVLDIRSGADSGAGSGQQVIIINPSSNDSAQEICNHVQAGRTVVCNFERCENDSPQRILDFVNGAAYALGGSVKRISSHIFLVIPQHVVLLNDSEREESNLSYLRHAAR